MSHLHPGHLLLILLLAYGVSSCSKQNTVQESIPLVLSPSLEARRLEFHKYVNSAQKNISVFAKLNGWEYLTRERFMDSVMLFDDKPTFNKILLQLAGADPKTELPETYCAALENGVLIAMSPEFYARVYPDGLEAESYTKLLTHEIAHRLHIRILGGDEEAMGPIWFYEGVALYAANQFSESDITLSNEEMIRIMREPERGSYKYYSYIFRQFNSMIPLRDLIANARHENFNEELIVKLKLK